MKSATALFLMMLCVCVALAHEPSYCLTNCWRMSEFAVSGERLRSRTADFSFLKTVKKDTFNAWVNGVSIDSFYAFTNKSACVNIRLGNPSSRYLGLYAVTTNDENGAVQALSLLGTGGGDMELMLPVELDSACRTEALAIDYRGWQAKIGTADMKLTFSWCAADGLDAVGTDGWTFDSAGDYAGGSNGLWRTVILSERAFADRRFVCLRWSVPKVKNSSMLGISDVTVTARLKPSGAVLLIR